LPRIFRDKIIAHFHILFIQKILSIAKSATYPQAAKMKIKRGKKENFRRVRFFCADLL